MLTTSQKSKTTYKVSIVLVTYNRRDCILQCLRSCLQQDYPLLEIVVVVNPSDDGTEAAISQEFPKVKLLRTHKNIGFFPALNMAIANTSGDYIMMVDDDAYFLTCDAISTLVQAFQNDPRLGAATCNIEGPKETPIRNVDHYISVFKTGFTMVPREVFTEWIGFYPDLFFRSAGETYICTALWDMGKVVKQLHNVSMYHELTMQGRSDWAWKFYGLRSQILCAIMREPSITLWPVLASKCCKSLILFIKWGHLLTWFCAWASVVVNLPEAIRLRSPISWQTRKLLWKLPTSSLEEIVKTTDYQVASQSES
jgi:GT2 family glycosyltransferase